MAFSARIYGVLIRAYPEDLQGEYGEEMVRSFRDLCRREVRRRGVSGLLLLWVRTLSELVFTSLKERSTMLARNAYLPVRPVVVARWGGLSALLGGALGTGAYFLGAYPSLPGSFVAMVLSSLLSTLGLIGLYGTLAESSDGPDPGRLATAGALLTALSVVSWLVLGAFWAVSLAWSWAIGPTYVAIAVASGCGFAGLLLLGLDALKTRLPWCLRILPITLASLTPVSVALTFFSPVGVSLTLGLPFLGTALLGWALLKNVGDNGLAVPVLDKPGTGTSAYREVGTKLSKASKAREIRSGTTATEVAKEKELLEALRRCGALTVAGAALETSLSVDEADGMLSALAAKGHLEVRVERGRLLYALWAGDE